MFNEFNGSDDGQLLELFWRLEMMFAVDGAKTLEAPDFAPGGPRTTTNTSPGNEQVWIIGNLDKTAVTRMS